MQILTLITFLAFSQISFGDDFIPKANFYKAKVLRIHDGDTIYAKLNLISSLSIEIGCRFFGVAAPELKEINGIEARKVVEKYLKPDDSIIVEYIGDDKYAGRIDSRIWILDKINNKYFCLNDELVKNTEIFGKMDKNGKKIK